MSGLQAQHGDRWVCLRRLHRPRLIQTVQRDILRPATTSHLYSRDLTNDIFCKLYIFSKIIKALGLILLYVPAYIFRLAPKIHRIPHSVNPHFRMGYVGLSKYIQGGELNPRSESIRHPKDKWEGYH
jgi:hypothetical protein